MTQSPGITFTLGCNTAAITGPVSHRSNAETRSDDTIHSRLKGLKMKKKKNTQREQVGAGFTLRRFAAFIIWLKMEFCG